MAAYKSIQIPEYKYDRLVNLKQIVTEKTGKPNPSIPDVIDYLMGLVEGAV